MILKSWIRSEVNALSSVEGEETVHWDE